MCHKGFRIYGAKNVSRVSVGFVGPLSFTDPDSGHDGLGYLCPTFRRGGVY